MGDPLTGDPLTGDPLTGDPLTGRLRIGVGHVRGPAGTEVCPRSRIRRRTRPQNRRQSLRWAIQIPIGPIPSPAIRVAPLLAAPMRADPLLAASLLAASLLANRTAALATAQIVS